jgi:hypothetical protein
MYLVWAPGVIVLNAISHVGFRIAIVPSNNQLNSDFSLRSQQHLLGPWREIQDIKGLHERGTLSLHVSFFPYVIGVKLCSQVLDSVQGPDAAACCA